MTYFVPESEFSITSIDTLVFIHGQWIHSGNGEFYAMDYHPNTECIYSPYLVRQSNGSFRLCVFSAHRNANRNGTVTIEYTKTTDTGGAK